MLQYYNINNFAGTIMCLKKGNENIVDLKKKYIYWFRINALQMTVLYYPQAPALQKRRRLWCLFSPLWWEPWGSWLCVGGGRVRVHHRRTRSREGSCAVKARPPHAASACLAAPSRTLSCSPSPASACNRTNHRQEQQTIQITDLRVSLTLKSLKYEII